MPTWAIVLIIVGPSALVLLVVGCLMVLAGRQSRGEEVDR